MSKQEILPPISRMPVKVEPVRVTAVVPTVRVNGDPISSALERWRWDRQSKAVDALTRLNQSESGLYAAQTQLVEQAIKRDDALFRFQDHREKLTNQLAVNRVERAEKLRGAQHIYESNEERRRVELAHVDTELTNARTIRTHAQTALTDAQQQLRAQEDLGEITYRIAHRKKHHELLDLEMDEAEKRAILNQNRQQRPADDYGDDVIDDALYEKREQLNTAGLDTSRIDAEIDRRKNVKNGG